MVLYNKKIQKIMISATIILQRTFFGLSSKVLFDRVGIKY